MAAIDPLTAGAVGGRFVARRLCVDHVFAPASGWPAGWGGAGMI